MATCSGANWLLQHRHLVGDDSALGRRPADGTLGLIVDGNGRWPVHVEGEDDVHRRPGSGSSLCLCVCVCMCVGGWVAMTCVVHNAVSEAATATGDVDEER